MKGKFVVNSVGNLESGVSKRDGTTQWFRREVTLWMTEGDCPDAVLVCLRGNVAKEWNLMHGDYFDGEVVLTLTDWQGRVYQDAYIRWMRNVVIVPQPELPPLPPVLV